MKRTRTSEELEQGHVAKRQKSSILGKHVHKIQHPTRLFVVGRAQMGKTTLTVKIIQERFSNLDRYIAICPSFSSQTTYDPIRHLFKKADIYENAKADTFPKIVKDIKAFNEFAKSRGSEKPKTLILFDDMAGTNIVHSNGKGSFASFSNQVTHWGATVVVLTQNEKRTDPSFRSNAENFIIFPSESESSLTWLQQSFNSSIFSKYHDFKDIVWQAWSAGGHRSEVGKHFLFIHSAPRTLSRFFCDFDREIVTDQ